MDLITAFICKSSRIHLLKNMEGGVFFFFQKKIKNKDKEIEKGIRKYLQGDFFREYKWWGLRYNKKFKH